MIDPLRLYRRHPTSGRFEVIERTSLGNGVDLWRILDHMTGQIEWVMFTGGQPGDRYARGWTTIEVEERHPAPDDVRAYMLRKLARAAGVDLSPPPPEPKTMTPPAPVLEPDAGYLWRRFIYGTD